MMKTTHLQRLALLVLLLVTAGCPVTINEGMAGGDDGPDTPECPSAELATVRFFHGAGGTPVIRPEFGPATTRNLTVVRADMDDALVTSLVAGRASYVQLCGNKPLMLGARLSGADENRATVMVTLTPDATPSAFDAGVTIVLAGIADTVVGGVPENPKSAADPLRFIVVPDTFSAGTGTEIQVVHASRKTPDPINVEVNPDSTDAEIMGLARYTASAVVGTRGSSDLTPSSVPVAFLNGTATSASFTISPRIPTGAKALAIHFDSEVYDPDNPEAEDREPPPVSRLFVTGDDPLLGKVAGGGITF